MAKAFIDALVGGKKWVAWLLFVTLFGLTGVMTQLWPNHPFSQQVAEVRDQLVSATTVQ